MVHPHTVMPFSHLCVGYISQSVEAPAFSSTPAHLSNLPEPTAEDAWGFESAPARKRASAPGVSFRTLGYRVQLTAC